MKKVCIIAEAGVNHNGDIIIAKKMVDVAKMAGVDYIKFQTFVPEKLVSRYAEKANYQKETTDAAESQLDMLRKLSLSEDEFVSLKQYCDEVGIGFISTPFDLESIDFLEKLEMDFWKIPSGEITNLPYLEKIARTGRNVILSTGMSDVQEIKDAVRILENNGSPEIVLLHCNTQYPTPFEDVNLSAMETMAKSTGKVVGYSDHTKGIEVPIAAVALGATVIEKHFTLDKNMEGPDHKASLEPDELTQMVSAIRHIGKAIGNGIKEATTSEKGNKAIARKSIVAACRIAKGEIFSEKNITTKRPGNGISPMRWHEVIGKAAPKDFSEDELIEL
ncbi:N-acetylneuraminate synthase [Anaerovibrio lipolyticus DSM 3074]|uniref:N-acetylneuraminate synthase n=1 Tax=Anaerovibrio lipolyticus DSM 3074 TaxID=1120997 RepID=A0A1M6FEP6_9FIRM|nr:N-acetylneuraminate synthase [Anaerovibrio lipolyticus]SHI96161.1 N-acetylneuraminate synthase [Anaerovibrio lipolyticus DSM 3074]